MSRNTDVKEEPKAAANTSPTGTASSSANHHIKNGVNGAHAVPFTVQTSSHDPASIDPNLRSSNGYPAYQQPPIPTSPYQSTPYQSSPYQAPSLQNSQFINPGYPTMMPAGIPQQSDQAMAMSGPPPTMAQAGSLSPDGEGGSDGRKAKRELSQSKRAAQNRAAQRAFRQRKEGYIKSLEKQVNDFKEWEPIYKAVHAENQVLKQYIFDLQSRFSQLQIEFPQPPPNLNLNITTAASFPPPAPPSSSPSDPHLQQHHHHHHAAIQQQPLPPAPPAPVAAVPSPMEPMEQQQHNHQVGAGAATDSVPNSLEVAAQAVAGLSRRGGGGGGGGADEDARTAEEITRQLQLQQQADQAPM
ncbi:putative transcription factor kapC [Diplogelasinospora grovesii]|uniref:Putative transcription factor kapC n=1 Tax=Diplogelasinospora grovesii TaxID=303347 RepID=A0AAN6NHL5_9PEZI|nr:putative transcription factor kapC [Diplogelasinospora grovesii]